MKKILLTLTSLFIVLGSFAQLPSEEIVESNKFNCDPRILLHYSNEDILAMDSVKFEMIKYYYCYSYTIDTTNAINFDINTFDISIYHNKRKINENVYIYEPKYNIFITLFSINTLLYSPL